jgi:hypothetical protein
MNTQMSRDFERLSAYIDNQLSPAEKAEREARLAKEPELQAGLNDLRRTVRALRSLPPVKPPRSFTLTPAQAGARARRGPLFPVLRLATALSALLLVVLVARDFTTSGLAASASNNAATRTGVTTPVLQPYAAPLVTATSEPGTESGGASAPSPTDTAGGALATTPLAHTSAILPSATPAGGIPQSADTPSPTIKNVAPGETPGADHFATASDTPQDTAVSVAALPQATSGATAPGLAPLPPAQGPSDLRLAEIVLAVLALVLAAATWLTRRG